MRSSSKEGGGMKTNAKNIVFATMLFIGTACQGSLQKEEDVTFYSGVVINEISAHAQSGGAVSWVELLNTSSKSIDISGIGLYLTDSRSNERNLYVAPEGKVLASGERMIVSTEDKSLSSGIFSNVDFNLKLALSGSGKAIDEFSPVSAFGEVRPQTARGSYQRIPDGTTSWRNLSYSSSGRENALFGIDQTKGFGVWVWSSYVEDLLADDCAELKELKNNSIDHIFLNYAAFTNSKKSRTLTFIARAEELGMTVHAWTQCFHNSSGWINPIDDDEKCYKDDIFENIVADAKTYIEDYGVKGIHLDYIRFPGTAPKHNINGEVNSVAAVTRCCREIRELCDSYDEGLITSAALMPDEIASGYYYGQNRTQMGQYLDVFIPMIYRYTYGYSDSACQDKANAFSGYGARCWAGTTTYSGGDSKAQPLDAASVMTDCEVYKGTKAEGIVLFRKGLGEIPDFTDFTFDE